MTLNRWCGLCLVHDMSSDACLLLCGESVKVISNLLISVSKAERQEARSKVRHDSLRLGKPGISRDGTTIKTKWEDGHALTNLNSRLEKLLVVKETIEQRRKSLKNQQLDKGDAADVETRVQEDFLIQDEICTTRSASIKREEEYLMQQRERYEGEKRGLMHEMNRIKAEDGSYFDDYRILNQRYALLKLLSKGGFSEVYKVDVWSAGVLFYQMLFGKRPFGHGQSQAEILREGTIAKARSVVFPSLPAVSSEAKDFIQGCLTYNQAERPDVLSIAQHPYLSYATENNREDK